MFVVADPLGGAGVVTLVKFGCLVSATVNDTVTPSDEFCERVVRFFGSSSAVMLSFVVCDEVVAGIDFCAVKV